MQAQLSQIVELYEITADVTHSLTSARQTVFWGGREWAPAALERSEIRGSVDGKPATVTLTACMDVLLTRYLAALPVIPTRVAIYEHEPDTGKTVQIYGGVVMEVVPGTDGTQVTARCSSASPVLDTGVPRMIYSGQCQFVLFDASCGLQAASWGCTTGITVKEATLISPDFATRPDGFFTRGYVAAEGDFRLITQHVGATLTLQLPFDGRVRNGSMVSAFPGCDGSPATCQNRFANSVRFGGCASIPSRNPAVWGFK